MKKQLPYDIFSEFLIGIVCSERVRHKYNVYMQHIIKFSTIVNDILTTILQNEEMLENENNFVAERFITQASGLENLVILKK